MLNMSGSDSYSFYKIGTFLCLYLRLYNGSQPVSRYRSSIETSLVAPMTILAASVRIFSIESISYCVQLSHTISAYSKTGRIKEKEI